MSNPHVPFDPDPLTPAEYRRIWIDGYDAGRQDAPRTVVKGPSRGEWAAVVLATFALLVSAFFFGRASAAPRSATTVIPAGTPNGSASIDRTPVPSGNPSSLSGAPLVRRAQDSGRILHGGSASPEAPTVPAPTTAGAPTASIAGVASWYRDPSQPADGLYAAVPSWHFGDRRYRVRVTAGDRSVVVTVRDFCGCPGARVIDLSPTAFEALAHYTRNGRYHTGLDLGLLPVVVEDLRASRLTPPPTDVQP